jgi:hypothetical protein
MISQVFRSTWLAAAIAFSTSVFMSARAEDSVKSLPALAAALKDAKVNLGDGLKASEREGKPVSAKFEIDDGKLQLSVYTMKADGFAEDVIDPKGGVAKPIYRAVGLPEKKGGVRHILGENPFVPQTAGYARGQGITRPGLASPHRDIGLAPLYQRLPPPSICAPTRAIAC